MTMFVKTQPGKAMLTLEIPAQAMSGHDISVKMPEKYRFTDDEFYAFCQANDGLNFERDKHGNITILMPAGGEISDLNGELVAEVTLWNRIGRGGKVLESNGAYRLPDKSVKAPDVSWVEISRWNALTDEEREKFPPLCPDFVIELMSKSDWLADCQEKMDEWMANGCRLAWLIDPKNENIYVYRQDRAPEIVSFAQGKLSGEDVLQGFELDLNILK